MWLVFVMIVVYVGGVCGEDPPASRVVEPRRIDSTDNGLANTELVLAFVIFRHGDRTPDNEELALYPSEQRFTDNIFFPYGKKALTNKGKQRSYYVGKYLRELYDGFISKLYLPDEITVRTTDYARTQMTALTALSALYPPQSAQKWNPNLDWQPIPYDTPPFDEDDLLYWYNCPRYLWLRDQMYEKPEVKKWIEPYEDMFKYLSEKTGTNITKTEDVFFLDNLFQTLRNVGVDAPNWAQMIMPKIKEVTKIEYAIELYNAELVQLASGVLMQSILNKTSSAIQNTSIPIEPKLYLYSAHENNVAALMAAARVFEAHQPNYGSTFSLELRKNLVNQEYGIVIITPVLNARSALFAASLCKANKDKSLTFVPRWRQHCLAVYARDAGGPGEILPIGGCGGQLFCGYNKFVSLVQDVLWSKDDMDKQCKVVTR